MEDKKEKAILNDTLLDQVVGGDSTLDQYSGMSVGCLYKQDCKRRFDPFCEDCYNCEWRKNH